MNNDGRLGGRGGSVRCEDVNSGSTGDETECDVHGLPGLGFEYQQKDLTT